MTPATRTRPYLLPILAGAACIAAMLGAGAQAQSRNGSSSELVQSEAAATVKESAAAVQRKLDEIEQALSGAATLAESRTEPAAQRTEVVELASAARSSLQRSRATLGPLAKNADRLLASDRLDELRAVSEALRGDLPARLGALADSLGKFGGTGPEARSSAEACRKLAGDFADAADQLQKRLNLASNRARLGGPAPDGQEDARFRQLVAQYGEDFAAAALYVPSSVPDVFRPAIRPGDRSRDVALIWDEQAGEWRRVSGEAPIETIFRDVSSALGRPPTPGQLKYLADNYGQVEKRRAMASAFAEYLREAAREEGKPRNAAFAHLSDGGEIAGALGDPAAFLVKFVYDGQFRAWMTERLDQLRVNLVQQGPPAQAALKELDALLDAHGVTLDSQWAEGVLPAVGAVRVVAWFSDNPKNRFASTWRFEKEKVAIEISGGHGHGTRKGNVVHSEGSLPGRNCTASDTRTFKEGGTLNFSAVYTCKLDNGDTRVSEVEGAGAWQVIEDRPRPGQKRAR